MNNMEDRCEAAGVYVHLPFCVVRCTYCDFYSLVGQDDLAGAYVGALVREIEAFPDRSGYRPEVASVYIGGGTPSHAPEGSVDRILESIDRTFSLLLGAEITVEANPESVEVGKLAGFRRSGANRMSIGVQSFRSDLLALMGRPHGPDAPARAVALSREAGFDNISLDLIYGLPGQTPDAWTEDLERAMALGPEHLSAYLLETDKDTPLARALAAGTLQEPDAALIEALFRATEARLPSAGYTRYEVSNWAMPGRESRHNLGYWNDRPCLGFGASSHSYYGGVRRACRLSAAAYVAAVGKGEDTRAVLDDGSTEVRLSESLVTALRLAEGADFDRLGARYGTDLWARHAADLDSLVSKGWMVVERPRVRLTITGILWSMDALAPFVSTTPTL